MFIGFLDIADELLLTLARIIVIGIGAAFYDELAGLLILLLVALSLLTTGAESFSDEATITGNDKPEGKKCGVHGHMVSR